MTLERRTPMNRGESTLRRTPMNRGTKGLETRAPIARTKPMVTRAPAAGDARAPKPRTRARHTGTTPTTRALVTDRDKGLCVRCGAPATDQDHRQGRGAGGTKGEVSDRINTAAAIITLCGSGNTSGCHGWKESNRHEAERLGYRLPRNGIQRDPARTPVLTRFGWCLPTVEGKWVPCAAPSEGDARLAA